MFSRFTPKFYEWKQTPHKTTIHGGCSSLHYTCGDDFVGFVDLYNLGSSLVRITLKVSLALTFIITCSIMIKPGRSILYASGTKLALPVVSQRDPFGTPTTFTS